MDLSKAVKIKYEKSLLTGKDASVKVIFPTTKDSDGNDTWKFLSIPMDKDNTNYQAILKWVEDGNTIEESD